MSTHTHTQLMAIPSLVMVIILASALTCTNSVLGFDLATLYNTSVYQCLKNQGYSFGIIRAFRSLGVVDANALQNLQNARTAGINTDVYLFPCRGRNASVQVAEMMAAVPNNLYGMTWIDIETNPSPNCAWTTDGDSNCAFIKELVSAVKARGKKVGLYATGFMWNQIFGNRTACQELGSEPLWYAHYDGKETLTDFVPFGGWTKPLIKQFADGPAVCGANIDHNYSP